MLDEFERDQLKTVLMHAIGEMGSEIERAIGEGLMAGLRATLDTPIADIPKATPRPRIGGHVQSAGPYTTSCIAPCGCSMPIQFRIESQKGRQPGLGQDNWGVLLGSHHGVGIALHFDEVGSPIPCSDHRPPSTPAHGSVYMSREALLAAWDVVRVADHFDDRHEGASTILGPIADVVEVNLADLRTLRAALQKEGS